MFGEDSSPRRSRIDSGDTARKNPSAHRYTIRTFKLVLLLFFELADQKLAVLVQPSYPRIEQQQSYRRDIPADAIFNGLGRLMDALLKDHPVMGPHTNVSVRETMAKFADLEKRLHPHLPRFVMFGICNRDTTDVRTEISSARNFIGLSSKESLYQTSLLASGARRLSGRINAFAG